MVLYIIFLILLQAFLTNSVITVRWLLGLVGNVAGRI